MVQVFSWISWNPPKEIFYLPFIDHPITWYGAILAMGCGVGYATVCSLYRQYYTQNLCKSTSSELSLQLRVKEFCETISMYCLFGILMGARLGHIFFYENIHEYLKYPLRIFMIWEGGISSHGAIVGAAVSVWYYLQRSRNLITMSFASIADLLAIPLVLGMAFVRLGNFINQESVGIATSLPWGIIFEAPVMIDGGISRHPVQIYEAIGYIALFYFLRKLYIKNISFLMPGKIASLFLTLALFLRFLLEYLKEESVYHLSLNIGQWLSIPFIIVGFRFLYLKRGLEVKAE